tara:strand:- start:81 stop:1766 length:1686 start_codon:yes stop_codon:yes gene_type:complete
MKILGISLGHDSNFCIIEDGEIKYIIESERFFRQKHYKLQSIKREEGNYNNGFQVCNTKDLKIILNQIKNKHGSTFDYIAVQNQKRAGEYNNLKTLLAAMGFKYKSIENFNHHLSHAAGAFFTSPFKDSLILSFDGAGNDGNSIILKGDRNKIKYIKRASIKFGNSYNNLGYIGNIGADVSGCTAGKTMGITSYGDIIDEWLPLIKKHILSYSKARRKRVRGLSNYGKRHSIQWSHIDKIEELKSYMKGKDSKLDVHNKVYQDLGKTFQVAWTECVVDFLRKYSHISKNLCITGGCALNGVTNYVIEKSGLFEKVHFMPNPSDCGLSMGAALLSYYKNSGSEFSGKSTYLSPYLGEDIYDKEKLPALKDSYKNKTISEADCPGFLANLICKDKIVGVIRGNSEIGPRALGNRSILCNSQNKEMRNILNEKVKNREWFRPFAPVCTYEDSKKYFTNDNEIPYMSVICYTKDEHKESLPSVTHVDGSCRLQTITKKQNAFLHSTLKEIEKINGLPICLNTSFNPGGEPILNYCEVGLQMLKDTDLDYVLIEDTIFWQKEENDL